MSELKPFDRQKLAEEIARYFAGYSFSRHEVAQCLGLVDVLLQGGYLRAPDTSGVELVRRFAELVDAIPLGEESVQLGSSAYNWGKHYLGWLQKLTKAEQWLKNRGA